MKRVDWEKAGSIAHDIAMAVGDRDYTEEPVFVGMLLAAYDFSERLHLTALEEKLFDAISDYFEAINESEEIKF